MKLKGRDARAVNAFFNSAFVVYDSRWVFEREGDLGKACEIDFRLPFTSSYLTPKERQRYMDMFASELVKSHTARWICWIQAHFYNKFKDEHYTEHRQPITREAVKLDVAMQQFTPKIKEAMDAGNAKDFLFYEWRIEVYKDQPLFATLDDVEEVA